MPAGHFGPQRTRSHFSISHIRLHGPPRFFALATEAALQMVNIANASFQVIQTSFFVAAMMNAVFYGTYLTLGAAAIYNLRQLTGLPRRTFRIMATLIVAVALLYTLFIVSMSTMLYQTIIIMTVKQSDWILASLSTAFSCLAAVSALGDALFTYRCWIIWERSRLIWIPCFILVTEFAALLATDILIANDGTLQLIQPQTLASETLSIAASSLTVCFNFMLALAAIVKLLLARRKLRRAVLPGGGAHYIQIAHLLAGSTVLYAAGWIPMIVWRRDTISIPYLSVLFFIVATLPLVIMLHVARRSHREPPLVLPEIAPGFAEGQVGSNASGDMFPTFKPFRRESDGSNWHDSRDAQDDAGVWRRESDATTVLGATLNL